MARSRASAGVIPSTRVGPSMQFSITVRWGKRLNS